MDFAIDAVAMTALCLVGTATIHAVLYGGARWRRARTVDGSGCAAESVGEFPVLRLVLAETVASIWLGMAAVRPGRLPLGNPLRARQSILLIGPAWLPARALTVLGRRLAETDAVVGVARMPRRGHPRALGRVAAQAEALGRASRGQRLVLLCYGGAGALAGSVLRLLPRAAVERLVLLGTPPSHVRAPHPSTVAIRAAGDPWYGEPAADGGRPTIEIVGVGHLTLLVAPHVADVVRDACIAPDLPVHQATS